MVSTSNLSMAYGEHGKKFVRSWLGTPLVKIRKMVHAANWSVLLTPNEN